MSNTKPTHKPYHSAYHGPIFRADGQFDHFARQIDESHIQNGYWRFFTYDDDRCAYDRGLRTPEDVLIAQDVGDDVYDDIVLRWTPGNMDTTSDRAFVGTAAAHLETIYNERRLLGKSLAFKGRVPRYPASTNQRLREHRFKRYEAKAGTVPVVEFVSPSHLETRTAQGVSSSWRKDPMPSRPPEPTSVLSPAPSPPPAGNGPVLTQVGPSEKLHYLSSNTHALSSVLIPPEESLESVDKPDLRKSSRTPILSQQDHCTHVSCECNSTEHTPVCTAGNYKNAGGSEMLHSTNASGLTEDDNACVEDQNCDMDDTFQILESSISHIPVLSLAGLPCSELENTEFAALPCMDCGFTSSHAPQCWIDKAAPSLQPVKQLPISKLRELTDSVIRFDPGPWTTHVGTLREPVEHSKTQIQGMAEVIRSLDMFEKAPDLHGLDDELTILAYGLNSPGHVQILELSLSHNG